MRKTTAAIATLAVAGGIGLGALIGAPATSSAAPNVDAALDVALASATNPAPDPAATAGAGRIRHPRIRAAVRRHAVEVVAKALGMAPADVRVELRKGSSIADVAAAKGVDLQRVVDALVAEGRSRIDQAVANGRITRERGDKLAAKLPAIADRIVHAHRQKR